MTDKIALPNLDDAAQKLRDQIRNAFVELLTPEQWQAMVKAELDKFSRPTPGEKDWQGQSKMQPSVLERLCEQEFRAHVTETLKKLVSETDGSSEFDSLTGNWKPAVSKAIKEWLTENGDKLVMSAVQALAQDAAIRVFAQIQGR